MRSVTKTVMSVMLSAMMALPLPSFAKNESYQVGATDGAPTPVLIEQRSLGGNRTVTVLVAPIAAADEARLVRELAEHNPGNTVLEVAGHNDPALRAAAQSGHLSDVSTYVTGTGDQAPVLYAEDLPVSVKQKLRAKLRQIKEFTKSDNANGLLFAAIYSGVQGVFTAYASSSVDSGLAVFSMFMMWNSFVLTKPELWGKMLDMGGRGATSLAKGAANLTGVQLSDRDKRIFEVVGKFAVSWAAAAAQGGYVKEFSGDFSGLHGWEGLVEGFAESSVSGVQNNYNIWDAVVLKKYEENGLTEKQVKWYFRGQMVVGALLESLAFRHVPGVGLFLGTVTSVGAVYLALHPDHQASVIRKAKQISVAFRAGVTYIKNPEYRRNVALGQKIRSAVRQSLTGCEKNLITAGFHGRAAYEDMQ